MAEASSSCINVLVMYGERRRPLTLKTGAKASQLKEAFYKAFEDVLESTKVFFQIESEQWGGRFVDLGEDEVLANSVVLKAVPVQVKFVNACLVV